MTKDVQLSEIVALVADFEKIDSSIPAAINAGNLEVIEKAMEAKKRVKRYLVDCKPLNLGRDLGIKLKKIRDNYGYFIDLVVEAIESTTGTKFSHESEEDMDYVDALFSQGSADYVDDNFFKRKNQVGTLIFSESLR